MIAWLTGNFSGQANLKIEAYGYTIRDATKAIELKPNFVKVRPRQPDPKRETPSGRDEVDLGETWNRPTTVGPLPMQPS